MGKGGEDNIDGNHSVILDEDYPSFPSTQAARQRCDLVGTIVLLASGERHVCGGAELSSSSLAVAAPRWRSRSVNTVFRQGRVPERRAHAIRAQHRLTAERIETSPRN